MPNEQRFMPPRATDSFLGLLSRGLTTPGRYCLDVDRLKFLVMMRAAVNKSESMGCVTSAYSQEFAGSHRRGAHPGSHRNGGYSIRGERATNAAGNPHACG
jgi:hypothetical protein